MPSTLQKITYNYPNIKIITGSKEVVNILVNKCKVKEKNIFLLSGNRWYDLGLCKVKLDELYHDVENYAIHIDKNGYKILYAVDTSSIDHIVAKGYDLYLIEANYKDEILDKHIREVTEENKGDLVYLERVKSTHLSERQATDFLLENMGKSSLYRFVHKSSYNNEEETKNGDIE